MRTPKVNWSLVMLASSLLTLSVVTFQAQQASQRHRETVLGLLGDYAGIAAFHYRGQLSAEVERFVTGLHTAGEMFAPQTWGMPTRLGQDHEGGEKLVGQSHKGGEESCACGGAGGVIASNYFEYSPLLGTLQPHLPMAPATAEAIVREVESHMDATRSGPYVLRVLPGGHEVIAFHTMRGRAGETAVFGGVADIADLVTFLGHEATRSELLPPSVARGIPADSLVYVAVYLPGAQEPLFSNSPTPEWLESAEETLDPRNGGLVLRAAIREEYVPLLAIGGLPRSRLPLLLVLLALSGALALLATQQMRRERALVKARENFVTSVSHELRTPLAQMRLYIDTLRMGRASTREERDWALSHVERETTRLTHLVENVLHVSRPQRAGDVAAPVVDASAEVAEVVESFRPLARSRRATLVTRLEPGAMVTVRREHLRQTLLNLLDNAVKYGPVGQQVRVESRSTVEHVEIVVSDEGPGVPPQERERIWQPYFRGSTPEALASGGTGVGLGIVRDLVRRSGGTVELVASERGGGARFLVRLPRVQVAPRESHPQRALQIS